MQIRSMKTPKSAIFPYLKLRGREALFDIGSLGHNEVFWARNHHRMMISGPRNCHYDSAYILGPEIFIPG